MKERELTCIVCPRGCALKVCFDSTGAIASVTGNACKRGITYATDECTHPRRTVTSTVRTADGGVCAVKTSDTVPKELVFELMKLINVTVAPETAGIGDVLIEDALGTGVKVVVTGKKSF